MDKKRSICHCAHCDVEPFCAAEDWMIGNEYDPCCPNMKQLRKQIKKDWEEYIEESIRIHSNIL